MVARKYSLVPDSKPAHYKGQCKIVYDELKRDTRPRLAAEVCSSISELPTKQDKLRVVLYYILVMKKQGIVRSFETTDEKCQEMTVPVTVSKSNIVLTDDWK